MFSYASVCPRGESHVAITNNALDLTVPAPPSHPGPTSRHETPHPLLVISDGNHWRPVQCKYQLMHQHHILDGLERFSETIPQNVTIYKANWILSNKNAYQHCVAPIYE